MKNTEAKKTKQQNWFKECFLERRFFVLVLGALLGIALFLVVQEYDLLSKIFFYSQEITGYIEMGRFITNLAPVILGLPIILFLWVFRTHDTKEQLDKAQTNIEQQDFHDALRMLADDKIISQEIAVLRLIDISKKNKIYDDTIKLAFIKRMKAPYKEAKEAKEAVEKAKAAKKSRIQTTKLIIEALQQVERRTYAQYIFIWFLKKYKNKNLDLKNSDLSFQDFRAKDNKGKKIKYFRAKKGNYFVLDSVNLTGADLTGVDLTRADLTGADLTGADLAEADLAEAILTGADLTGAKGLTYEQLASVKSLDGAKGLKTVLKTKELTRLTAEKKELFQPPKEEQNETKI